MNDFRKFLTHTWASITQAMETLQCCDRTLTITDLGMKDLFGLYDSEGLVHSPSRILVQGEWYKHVAEMLPLGQLESNPEGPRTIYSQRHHPMTYFL